jgi:dTDP-4-amino-4,6-dideoxygalactose transaminase
MFDMGGIKLVLEAVSKPQLGTKASDRRLALHGGEPVRSALRRWPEWPVAVNGARDLLEEVLCSNRWTLSSAGDRELFERRFAKAFAAYVGSSHCVPVDHGSSALVIGLEALGLDEGALVAIPSFTWVACAAAVFRAGLVPVLVDVDKDTGCIGPSALDVYEDVEAVMAVHMSCVMTDVPALVRAAESVGAVVVEDVSQAHGARWLDRSAGSIGTVGCFSMQQTKVLAAGEGGAVVTDDPGLATVLEELRADSRRPPTTPIGGGKTELVEAATYMMGANFCLDEFNAAILCAQLEELDAQHETRNANHDLLESLLADVEGVRLLRPRPAQTRMSIYEASFIFDPLPSGMTNERLAEALTAELGLPFYPPRDPLHRSRLLRPWAKPSLGARAQRFRDFAKGTTFPNSDYLARHSVLTHHRAFLGTNDDMVDMARAVRKVVEVH